jgi:NAD(P)H-dependent FMN reductase
VRLTVFNGSPRGKRGNTQVFLEHYLRGFGTQATQPKGCDASAGNSYEIFYLNRVRDTERFVQAFAEAEHVLLAFPLYTDAMPGLVKAFFEALEPLCGRQGNPDIGFIVQSGFPEAAHSRYVERYLEKLASRLGCRYVGTMVKGGGEGARVVPDQYRKPFEIFCQLGKTFGETGQFDQALLRRLAKPERYPRILGPLFQWFLKTKLATSHWDSQLRENGAYEERFAQPYTE